MRVIHAFGFISGLATTVGYLPHLLALGFILASGTGVWQAMPLIVFTIGAKILGEWLFWGQFFPIRMDSEATLKNWRFYAGKSLVLKPTTMISLLYMHIDAAADALLIYMALKTSIPPAWLFFTFIGCQAVSAPIQGVVSDYLRLHEKRSLLFSIAITMLAVAIGGEISSGITPRVASYSLINIFWLDSFAAPAQIMLVLCAKGLLTNTTVTARAKIANDIQSETLKSLRTV